MRRIHFTQIASTNTQALHMAVHGEAGPIWITADEQTGGRGRLGRTWISKPGNLYATFLFQHRAGMGDCAQLAFVASLALHDAVLDLIPAADLLLKWPNDLLLAGGKLAGILAESGGDNHVVLGFGVNLAHAPEKLPYEAAALGGHISPDAMLTALDMKLVQRLAQWQHGQGFPAIRTEWQAHSLPLGSSIAINDVMGTYLGLDEGGGLLVKDETGRIRLLHAGDVRLITRAVP